MRIQVRAASLEKIEGFYGKLLGLPRIGGFAGRAGFDGVMFGLPDARVHLEFTQAEHAADMPEWSAESVLVFYIPDMMQCGKLVRTLDMAGVERVDSLNPYWEHNGVTFLDPNGRGVVIFNSRDF